MKGSCLGKVGGAQLGRAYHQESRHWRQFIVGTSGSLHSKCTVVQEIRYILNSGKRVPFVYLSHEELQ